VVSDCVMSCLPFVGKHNQSCAYSVTSHIAELAALLEEETETVAAA